MSEAVHPVHVRYSQDKNFIYLSVHPKDVPSGQLEPDQVLEALIDSGFSSFEYQLEQDIFDELIMMPWKRVNQTIVRRIAFRIEFELAVRWGPEQMQAWITLKPAFATEQISRERLLTRLQAAGIHHGLREAALEEVLANHSASELLIAEGIPPRKGQDGYLELKVPPLSALSEAEIESGTLLAIYHPPSAGEAGISVSGQSLPAVAGKDQQITLGEGCVWQGAESREIRASHAGIPIIGRKNLRVDKLLKLSPEELQAERYFQSLLITGDLPPGTRVETTGHLLLDGQAQEVSLCAGADLLISGPVTGPGLLQAVGNLHLQSVQECFLVCGQDLWLQQQAEHCQGFVAGCLRAEQAQWVGGRLHVLGEARVRELGHPAGIPTELVLGAQPWFENRLNSLRAHQRGMNQEMAELLKALIRARREQNPEVAELESQQKYTHYQNFSALYELALLEDSFQHRPEQPLRVLHSLWGQVLLQHQQHTFTSEHVWPAVSFDARLQPAELA